MMFITSFIDNKNAVIPVNHLYIKESSLKTKITKTFTKQDDSIVEMNTIELISSINTFIMFKVSFNSVLTANDFIKEIEEIMNYKDIREKY